MLISDTFLLAAMKCLTKSIHRKEGLFGSQFKEQPVVAGKAWRRECQVASHIAAAVERQKELMLVPCSSSFYFILSGTADPGVRLFTHGSPFAVRSF